MKFLNPYQFIPIDTSATKTIKWKEREDLKNESNPFLRHDYWHEDGISGRISCELKCISPVVVGGRQFQGDKKTPGVVKPYRHPDGSLAIPANSLRGMIGNVTEIISQSSLRVLTNKEDTVYSQRKQANRGLKEMGILIKEADKYWIYPFSPLEKPIPVADYTNNNDPDTKFVLKAETFHYKNKNNRQFVYAYDADPDTGANLEFARNLSRNQHSKKTKGILYIRGKHENMPNKKREWFIPWDGEFSEERIKVDNAAVSKLANILRLRHHADSTFPHLPQGYQGRWKDENAEIVESGDLLYYDTYGTEPDRKVCELSYSSIWRTPVNGNLYKALKNSGGKNALPWNPCRTELTPAEWLFGVTEENPLKGNDTRNIASRVRFSDALPNYEIQLPEKPIRLKILASPKPPSPSMYFTGPTGEYISKSNLDLDNAVPNGRKVYLSHRGGANVWQTKFGTDEKDNWEPHLSCTPIPAVDRDEDKAFQFFIYFENLSGEELGLLRTALNPGDNFVHRLGLGKPLGLGHVAITIKKIETINRKKRYSPESLRQTLRYENLNELVDTALVNQDALERLMKLGVPDYDQFPVCYPFLSDDGQKPYNEDEGFRWFVENEGLTKGNDRLKSITPGQPLSPLESSHSRIILTYRGQKVFPRDVNKALKDIGCDIVKIQRISLSRNCITIYLVNNEDVTDFQSRIEKSPIEFNGSPCGVEIPPRT